MSTLALPVHVALVDTTGSVPAAELTQAAADLTLQVHRDFRPIWHALGAISAYPADAVPLGTWRIELDQTMDQPGALGYHSDEHNQPYAKVLLTEDWSVTTSHELLEMLADPWGNRMHGAKPPQGINPSDLGISALDHVQYLVEVCDPPEATSYEIGQTRVSDFLRTRWYNGVPAGPPYSQAGGCTAQREVADGGYVSFARHDGEWFQVFNESGSLQLQDIGKFSRADFASLREFTDHHARAYRAGKSS